MAVNVIWRLGIIVGRVTASHAGRGQYTRIFANEYNRAELYPMPDKFDSYREALVVENSTVWPEKYDLDPRQRVQMESLLHENPEAAAHLEYVRTHTGFCRQIVVTDDDYQRISS